MTIKTIMTCDHCKKEIKDDPAFTVTSKLCDFVLRIDFCHYDCMKTYLLEKWSANEG
jgi:hypothetical protein